MEGKTFHFNEPNSPKSVVKLLHWFLRGGAGGVRLYGYCTAPAGTVNSQRSKGLRFHESKISLNNYC